MFCCHFSLTVNTTHISVHFVLQFNLSHRLLNCLCKVPDILNDILYSQSQYVLVSSPLCGRLTRYCFIFKSLGLEFVVQSLWGVLSDERPGLSFVSHSLIICLCVHLLLTFCVSHIYHIYIYILYTHCTTHVLYTRRL
jgi:hypothetical protein